VIKMAEIPKDMKFLLFGRGAKWMARWGMAFSFLAGACLIVGIIGDATNKKLGLEPTSWFIMAVAFFLAAFWSWLTAYFQQRKARYMQAILEEHQT
jgi:hypothetical protein